MYYILSFSISFQPRSRNLESKTITLAISRVIAFYVRCPVYCRLTTSSQLIALNFCSLLLCSRIRYDISECAVTLTIPEQILSCSALWSDHLVILYFTVKFHGT